MFSRRALITLLILAALVVAFYLLSVGLPAVRLEDDVIDTETLEVATDTPAVYQEQGAAILYDTSTAQSTQPASGGQPQP